MQNILFIAVLILVGQVLKTQSHKFPRDFAVSLNGFIIYISVPALILLQIPKIEINSSLLMLAVTPWALLAVSVFAALIISSGAPKDVRMALLIMLPLGNTSFLGIPLIEALYGGDAIKYVMVYDQLGTFLILSVYGSLLLAYHEIGKPDMVAIVKKVLTFPPFLFLCFAFAYGDMPEATKPYLQTLANTLTPLALVSVGYSLNLRFKGNRDIFVKVTIFKMLFAPLLVAVAMLLTNQSGLVAKVAILESGMPVMITAGALAISAGLAPELAAALVGYGVLISLVSIPLLDFLLGFILS